MFLEKIKSEGIAHLSYMLGSGASAAVIDPRRDIEVYLEMARREGVNITHIFETHRNEDYVIGSIALAEASGAKIYHGQALDFAYGFPVSAGDTFEISDLKLEILETPGHTFESISIAVYDPAFGDKAVGVFTGDALFIGDVGRTDFYPEQAERVAGLLYDSIFKQLLPLGDQVILYPAHGAGSVCGSGMASREFSTLGYERMYNPVLQKTNRDEFIQYKINERHTAPPYFKKMEQYNQQGAPQVQVPRVLPALTPDEFEAKQQQGMQVVDTRSPEAICGTYMPDSLAIPLKMLPAFAGWFLSYDRPIGLILQSDDEIETAVRHLYRLGYDRIEGYLAGGMGKWEMKGKEYQSITALYAGDLMEMVENNADVTLLDVRSPDEYETGHLPNALNIYVGHLPSHLHEISSDWPVVTYCGSGRRAVVAASILKKNGFSDVQVCLGSIKACKEIGCQLVS